MPGPAPGFFRPPTPPKRVSSHRFCHGRQQFGNVPIVKSFEHLFEGLTIRRVLWVTVVAAAAAAAVVWLFFNTYLDLLVTALCVGYTSMVLFTVAGNIRQSRVPREAMQILAKIDTLGAKKPEESSEQPSAS